MAYDKYQHDTSLGFVMGTEWYIVVISITTVLLFVGLVALGASIHTWWTSFRPLRQKYVRLARGENTDLPPGRLLS